MFKSTWKMLAGALVFAPPVAVREFATVSSTARGIRSLLEMLGLRVCAATGSTGDDVGVQRATHHILYGPQV